MPWLGGALLVVLIVLAYLPANSGDFIWDDAEHLTENPSVIGPLGLADIWTTLRASSCPLVLTTFWAEHRLWGLDPWPYHAVNILMHAAAALALWRVLLQLRIPGAWLGAALWAVHPVQVESVAWITELKNTQSALFFLLSVLSFCRSRQAPPADQQRASSRLHYGLALLFGVLAMASKSSTVVLPLVLWLCAWWIEGAWNWRRNLLHLAPLFLAAALAGVLTMWAQELRDEGLAQEWALSSVQRIDVAGRSVWFYLGKLVWPFPLMAIYPRWNVTSAGLLSCVPAFVVAAASWFVWHVSRAGRSAGRGVFLAWAYFVTALLPVLGFLDHDLLPVSFVFDHFQYLASMGPLALAGAGIHASWSTCQRHLRHMMVAACSAALLFLAVLTWNQCAVYRTAESLWMSVLKGNPGCWVAHNNLGGILERKGQRAETAEHFRLALRAWPRYAEAHNNLGIVLAQGGGTDEAILHFLEAVAIRPSFAGAHFNLGVQLLRQGRNDEALNSFQKTVENNPDSAEGQHNLGVALQRKGRLDEALLRYQRALSLRADYAEAHNNIGSLLGQRGQQDEAKAHFQKAVALDPGFAEARENLRRASQITAQAAVPQTVADPNADSAGAHNDLGISCGREGQLARAIAEFRRAIEIRPDFAEAHYNLGFALQKSGQSEKAATEFAEAIEIRPDYVAALRGLAYLLSASNQASLRNGSKAVELALRASELTGGKDPMILGTLAAAQAESQSFPEAVTTAQTAIHLAETQGLAGLASTLQQHLKFYESHHPLRGVQ